MYFFLNYMQVKIIDDWFRFVKKVSRLTRLCIGLLKILQNPNVCSNPPPLSNISPSSKSLFWLSDLLSVCRLSSQSVQGEESRRSSRCWALQHWAEKAINSHPSSFFSYTSNAPCLNSSRSRWSYQNQMAVKGAKNVAKFFFKVTLTDWLTEWLLARMTYWLTWLTYYLRNFKLKRIIDILLPNFQDRELFYCLEWCFLLQETVQEVAALMTDAFFTGEKASRHWKTYGQFLYDGKLFFIEVLKETLL